MHFRCCCPDCPDVVKDLRRLESAAASVPDQPPPPFWKADFGSLGCFTLAVNTDMNSTIGGMTRAMVYLQGRRRVFCWTACSPV